MNLLTIWITLPSGEQCRLGEIVLGNLRADGTAPTAFRYAMEWLERPDAFPISPDTQELPLGTREFHASHLGFPLMVFNDALPDSWGQRLIVAALRLSRTQQTPYHFMRAIAGNGLGALSFGVDDKPPARVEMPRSLDELSAAAVAFDSGLPLADASLHRLYAAGGSPGGARPKILACDSANAEWIVKLPSASRDRSFDVVGLEAACLVLARHAGLATPESQLIVLGEQRALMVKRFDITASGGRCHMISLSTLCRESAGAQSVSYNDPANAIRKYSDDAADVARFFRQMVFNAAIGNTDDHLKNFLLLRDERGYRLSPAYDLVPNIGQNFEHVLAMGYHAQTPDRATLQAVARQWLIDPAWAIQIADEVIVAVRGFAEVTSALNVEARSVEVFSADIAHRIAILER